MMFRQCIIALAIFLGMTSSAWATAIGLSPFLSLSQGTVLDKRGRPIDRLDLVTENLTIVRSLTSSSTAGSGFAEITAFNTVTEFGVIANVALLFPGPGSATVSALSQFTYDLVFPRPGRYLIPADVRGAIGTIDILEGSSGFADFSIFTNFANNSLQIGTRFGPFDCGIGERCRVSNLDGNSFDIFLEVGRDLRVPVESSLSLEIGVSRTVAVTEPPSFALIPLALLLVSFVCRIRPSSCRSS